MEVTGVTIREEAKGSENHKGASAPALPRVCGGRGTTPVAQGWVDSHVRSGDCLAHYSALQSRQVGMQMGRNQKGNKPKDIVYFKGINSVLLSFVEEEKSQDGNYSEKGSSL